MAIQRLDQQFRFESREPIQPGLRRLAQTLEARFQSVEQDTAGIAAIEQDLRVGALQRIADAIEPAIQRILDLSEFGFLVADAENEVTLTLNETVLFIVPEGAQRDYFAPTAFVTMQHGAVVEDYGFGTVESYDRPTGELRIYVTEINGAPGPFDDWQVTGAPGVAQATRTAAEGVQAALVSALAAAASAEEDREQQFEANALVTASWTQILADVNAAFDDIVEQINNGAAISDAVAAATAAAEGYRDDAEAAAAAAIAALELPSGGTVGQFLAKKATAPFAEWVTAPPGNLTKKGTWNAATNTPAIPVAGGGNLGWYYAVSVTGNTLIDGINDWAIGDWIISNGVTWDKIDNSSRVVSVAGKAGVVTLLKSDVGLNLVDNTADASKPVSTAQATALAGKAATAAGIPTGGATGAVLAKASGADYDKVWVVPPTAPVTSVAGKTGAVTLNRADVGLNSVDNTPDANKPISTFQAAALNAKAAKVGDTFTGPVIAPSLVATSFLRTYGWGNDGNHAIIFLNLAGTNYLEKDVSNNLTYVGGLMSTSVQGRLWGSGDFNYVPANKAGETFTGPVGALDLVVTGVPGRVYFGQAGTTYFEKAVDDSITFVGVGPIKSTLQGRLWGATDFNYIPANRAGDTFTGPIVLPALTAIAGTIQIYGFGGNNNRSIIYLNVGANHLLEKDPAGNLTYHGGLIISTSQGRLWGATDFNYIPANAAGQTFTGPIVVPAITSTGGAIQIYGLEGNNNYAVIYLNVGADHRLEKDPAGNLTYHGGLIISTSQGRLWGASDFNYTPADAAAVTTALAAKADAAAVTTALAAKADLTVVLIASRLAFAGDVGAVDAAVIQEPLTGAVVTALTIIGGTLTARHRYHQVQLGTGTWVTSGLV